MSDKFFFKGRKDARQTTLTYGYERNASRIAGSKKSVSYTHLTLPTTPYV